MIVESNQGGGPILRGTKAEQVRLHDDKTTYTGVYAQGGPTTVDDINPAVSFGQPPVAAVI
jgi:hypothetical protein